jgi:hypothetical protein
VQPVGDLSEREANIILDAGLALIAISPRMTTLAARCCGCPGVDTREFKKPLPFTAARLRLPAVSAKCSTSGHLNGFFAGVTALKRNSDCAPAAEYRLEIDHSRRPV